jgi:hypothetical protein
MKTLFLFLLVVCGISAQSLTTITGPAYDSSGALATCQLTIRPVSVPGFSPTTISYTIVAGDLTGSSGGYGAGITNVLRHAALQLYPGRYSVTDGCQSSLFASKPYTWQVPAVGSWSLANLNQGIGQRLGQIATTLGSTPATLGAQ